MAVMKPPSGSNPFYIVGQEVLAAKFRRMNSSGWIAKTLGNALYLEAEFIMTEAKKQTPVDTGNLRSTGHVDPPEMMGSDLYVELGFGGTAAKYALSVHENPRSGKTRGITPSGQKRKRYASSGKWKYLEDPFNAAQPRIAKALGRDLRYGIRKLGV